MSDAAALADFIRSHTTVASPPLLPEVKLWLATEVTPIWHATEATLAASDLPPPFWAFAWAGGQALARHVLDHPETVAGHRVLDFGAGSGLVAIAAAQAGGRVTANDVDPVALAAVRLNAALNGQHVDTVEGDLMGEEGGAWDVVLAGDVCYEQPLAERATAWLRRLAAAGQLVLLADPGRAYRPTDGLVEVNRFVVPTSRELEDRGHRETVVWRLVP